MGEALVLGGLEFPHAPGLGAKESLAKPSCDERSGLEIQVHGVERTQHDGTTREHTAETREPAGSHVDDVWLEPLELLAQRAGERAAMASALSGRRRTNA